MHEIQALIGSDATTTAVVRRWSEARRLELNGGFFIVPLQPALVCQMMGSDWLLPDLDDADEAETLIVVVAPLVHSLRSSDLNGQLALVFTQYWGGPGNQAALLLTDDLEFAKPIVGFGAINSVLSKLGVRADPERDEFETVGLGRWRSTETIFKNAR